MLSPGGVSITVRVGSSSSTSCSSSYSSLFIIILLCLICALCSTVVQSASDSDVIDHNNFTAKLDLPAEDLSELTGGNATRVLRRGKRFLEFTKGSRMSVGYVPCP